ncbi:MAG: VCBS repeat-containing protein [Pyrinomonadaceae bacterium]|nr:VCBS repeat-containing protein [Pyrinomonadaceae bacterium]
MKKLFFYAALVAVAAAAGLNFKTAGVMAERASSDDRKTGTTARPENTTPQTLPFTQDWTNIGLITANDDWASVPGIQGFLGDYTAASPPNVDPRTVLQDMTTIDVIANQTNPDTLTSGGVAEFDTIANPVVALNGSGTADAPSIILYVNTTGQSNIRLTCNLRDIDASADNSAQQINVQYRVGSTGDFSNVPGGYLADVSAGPSLTLTTPLAVTLPPQANNKPEVQIRIMTTNAGGSDEWIGIDDISVTPNGPPNTARTAIDYDGNGKTDYSIVRDEGTFVWYTTLNGGTGASSGTQWGIKDDQLAPADYDGDGKTDIAVWRPSPGNPLAYFYILQSSTGTFRVEQFGSSVGDDPAIVGDYDGDGKADLAVFRRDGTAADPCGVDKSVWYYRPSGTPGADFTAVCWGQIGDTPTGGDFDGDGKFDFMVRRNLGGNGVFFLLRSSDGGFEAIYWGRQDDTIAPGDYDGDGKYDLAVGRLNGSDGEFYILERDGGGTGAVPYVFGNIDGNVDNLAQGDYDGDGKQDVAVLKLSGAPGPAFIIRRSSNAAIDYFPFGQAGDFPAAAWNETCGGGC